MAVEAPVLYNDWWVYLRDSMGSTWLNPNSEQIHNAYMMRDALRLQGYDDTAIAGVIGNAQVESSLTTGAIQKWSVLPNSGERLQDVPNSYMLQYYTPTAGGQGYGLGLLQWDRFSSTYQSQDLLGWTNANGYNWYDGIGQMARLDFEFNNDSTYHFWRQNYNITWAEFKDFENSRPTWDAGDSADVWASNWELSSLSPEGRQHRKDNALFWYQYFIDHPIEPSTPNIVLLWMMNRRKELKPRCQRI